MEPIPIFRSAEKMLAVSPLEFGEGLEENLKK